MHITYFNFTINPAHDNLALLIVWQLRKVVPRLEFHAF